MTTNSSGFIGRSGTEARDERTGLTLPSIPGYSLTRSDLAADIAGFTFVSGDISGLYFDKPALLVNIGGIDGVPDASNYNGGEGVVLHAGGIVANAGDIFGGGGAVSEGSGGSGGDGIRLDAGGIVLNAGMIGGGDGAAAAPSYFGGFPVSYSFGGSGGDGISGSRGLVINVGTISGGSGGDASFESSPIPSIAGSGGVGVRLGSGGVLVNFGEITGGAAGVPEPGFFGDGGFSGAGVILYGGKTADINFGDIVGGAASYGDEPGLGVELVTAGTFTNFGTVSGGAGVLAEGGEVQLVGMELAGGSTLFNYGSISSGNGSGDAVLFDGGGSKLTIDASAKFSGTVASYGDGNVIELTGSKFGTLNGLGSSFTGFQTLDVDARSVWAVSGNIATLANAGTVDVANGTSLDVTAAVDPHSTGEFALTGKSSLEIAQLLGTNTKIAFLGGTDSLIVDQPAKFGLNVGGSHYAGPLLEDFAAGDKIDLKGVGYKGLGTEYNSATGLLQVTSSGGGAVASLDFQTASLGAGSFHLTSDGADGVFLTRG